MIAQLADPIAQNEVSDNSPGIAGAHTSALPIGMPARSFDGHVSLSFGGDWYYRIHVIPGSLSFGAISSDVEDTYMIWNAWFEAKNVTHATSDVLNNVTLEDENAVSYTGGEVLGLGYLGMMTMTVKALEDGPPTFDITHTWTSGDENLTVDISGVRVILFPWRAQEGLEERLKWVDQIIESNKATTEQRIVLTAVPRQFFKMEFVIDNEQDQSQLDALLNLSLQRFWAMPVWSEGTDLSGASILAGDGTLTFDTSYADYRAGGMAVIWQDKDTNEVVPIQTVNAGSLVLAGTVVGNYIGAVTITPARTALAQGNLNKTDNFVESSVLIMTFMISDNAAVTGYTPADTLDGLPIVHNAYSMDDTVTESILPKISITDYGTGAFEFYDDKQHIQANRTYRFVNDTPAECWDFRQLLHSLYGRQKPFLVPTYKADMELYSQIGTLDVTFQVDPIGLAEGYGAADLRKYLMFTFADGSPTLYRIVTGIVAGVGYDTVTITAALGSVIDLGDVVISWLDTVRFTEAQINMIWERMGRNTVDASVTRIEE